ncbi:acyltransferase [Thermomonas hydrothermalis]|uniref:1-acyl-sn-glycerol-3-phosphate acyltransferase n=1 Tax=Thermomonas hydrothermalis TaxID=213588 RepID=A0A1M4V7N6_9GAMM|nr:acyltransferase [Thermomonas hydrothermalis]SHE64964.1 1-acyl-sn-glycerol-3-phosphate acyltransferase [Thermomonas hydrothermalis]
MALIRALIPLILLCISTVVHVVPLLLVALLKALLPGRSLKRRCDPLLTGIAESWIGFNNWLWDRFTKTRLVVDGAVDLQRDGHYLVLANHQSWVDIVVLQKVFNRRIPLLRFFLKRQLFWVPLLGLAWWALDFPFMGRYTPKQIARNPALAGRDIAVTRRACAKFREIPVAIMNFVEGTRFSADKHARQGSPYRHLLKPKSGGVAFVLEAMGQGLNAILDVTIAYPAGVPSMLDLFADRVPEVRVRIRQWPIPAELVGGDYQNDRAFRVRFQQWMNDLWARKDADLDALLKVE